MLEGTYYSLPNYNDCARFLYTARQLTAKLDMYRKLTNALAVAVIVSIGWICYENAWIIPALWQVLSFSLLCVICALWAPSQNSMRYAYSEGGSEEFDKDDTLRFIKPSPMPSKDVQNPPEVRSYGSNGVSNGDLEEDKTEQCKT